MKLVPLCIFVGCISLASFSFSSRAADQHYREAFRPQLHFTPAKNWMNDPNGLVYFDGEYHLFYQYNPYGDKWGHMSWGHAISRDLFHWEHLPVALAEENDVMIFSGSAVVDSKNTSGFGEGGKPPLVAIYTGHYTRKPLQNQNLAYSNDRGRTWTKYKGNPVLDINERDFRDPKVFWHEKTRRWIMAVAWPVQRKVRFYSSANLKAWTHLSDFGPAGSTTGIWECPDLFPLPVESARGGEKWVLVVNVGSGAPAGGSGSQYFVGQFDGTQFTLDWSYPRSQPEVVPEGDLVVDFEGADYRGWQATGDAFGPGPAHGSIGGQAPVTGLRGQGMVNTFFDGDKSTGTLTSAEFELSSEFASFLIGGGNRPGKTCLNLIVNSNVVRTATGDDSERLTWKSWDLHEFHGQRGRLQIVDVETNAWGHVLVDHIVFADTAAKPPVERALWADFGPDFYAGVSWNDAPRRDDHRLWLGWMSNWRYANDVPTFPWRSAMTLPRELALRQTTNGVRLVQYPARECRKLHDQKHQLSNANVLRVNEWLRREMIGGSVWQIDAEIEPPKAGAQFTFQLMRGPNQATILGCDTRRGVLWLDRTRSGRIDFHSDFPAIYEAPLNAGKIVLRIFIDTSSIEVFANDGETVLTSLVFPATSDQVMKLATSNDALKIKDLTIWKLTPTVPIPTLAVSSGARRAAPDLLGPQPKELRK
jgi:fructan beta-fructosidase